MLAEWTNVNAANSFAVFSLAQKRTAMTQLVLSRDRWAQIQFDHP
jgi:hypothetical protein